ncbi:hypothetical protein ABET11_22735 [Priestia megaterium]|jgi:hypothetical protein|uniref:hypothetical protein n=1 Tax=Priestia TaxID=2800373 RepID=UPI000BF56F1C|nr:MULTISPECIES: hypothetical protein [Priestia]MDH6651157.1 hypothetical protein [Bacillus sp. PvP124]MDP9580056.1 hypothetical protein [Bacillus sp. 1751]RFB32377.1 hypothetical protein DZB86_30430 [Bacillus sp. RC]MCM3196768.1 hypothetical protein [Priestia megaterium]MDH2364165.1 hypothetical protein [Priestia megaterium]
MNPTIVDALIKKLSLLNSNKEYVELAVDLNDIYESSNKLDRLITDTLSSSLDQEKLIEQLIEIEVELDHINWHYKSLKKELKQLLNT